MKNNDSLTFIETPPFERHREEYFGNNHYRLLQNRLMTSPEVGDVIRGSGGIRELRWGSDDRGKQGGTRVIYYYLSAKSHIYLLTLYCKSEIPDFSDDEINVLRHLVGQIEEN